VLGESCRVWGTAIKEIAAPKTLQVD